MSFRLARATLPRAAIPPLRIPVRSLFTRAQGDAPSTVKKAVAGTLFVAGTTLFLVYYFDSRSAMHRYVVMPLTRHIMDGETGHKAAVKLLRSGLAPRDTQQDDKRLAVEVGIMNLVHSLVNRIVHL